jgi:hypothetical protein
MVHFKEALSVEYHLTPSVGGNSTCGNCEDPAQTVPITIGVRVSGRSVWIEGPEAGDAVICTRAGYGAFFDNHRASTGLPDYDVDEETFLQAIRRPISQILGSTESCAARRVFVDSSFMKEYSGN